MTKNKQSNEQLTNHLKELIKERKDSPIPYGDLKLLDMLFVNQLLTINLCQFNSYVFSQLFIGTVNTIKSLNITQEELPMTFDLIKEYQNEINKL